MGKMKAFLFPIISLALSSTFLSFSFCQEAVSPSNAKPGLQTYIVFVDKHADGLSFSADGSSDDDLHNWYTTFLPPTTLSTSEDRIVHSYRTVVTGFAAKLTPEEAKSMEDKPGFVSARVEKTVSLHTTHTPKFLGLLQQDLGSWNLSNSGEGVIIGVIDTGIKFGHPSFSDEGMPPPPEKWKGRCEFTGQRTCNNKLIGARSFPSEGKGNNVTAPFEEFFHGSHTAAEAAGSAVEGANVFGQANGTAMGIAPKAHLAMYKICILDECFESALIAAMDAAIEDGLDVLSFSLGVNSTTGFYDDAIALGSFRAVERGIFVSCSAGNGGPDKSSLINDAPWILTVGASTIDREIRATVILGNSVELHGQSLYQPKGFSSLKMPVVDPAASGVNASAAFCGGGSLKNVDVKGKVVLCRIGGGVRGLDKGQEVKNNGGAAMILINPFELGFSNFPNVHVLPASQLSYQDGLTVTGYLNSTQSPTAAITFQGTLIGKVTAPTIAAFSSRGPSLMTPGILKPDIVGPGMNILAAWAVSVDNATDSFNIVSGTSMSCPHLSGVAALVKSAHPDWSPAAVKSAILTTAHKVDRRGNPISTEQNVSATVFDMGSGHVNPRSALNPGLVYDLKSDDYVPYLCGLGYNDTEVRLIVQKNVHCSNVSSIPEAQLNYPTFAVSLLGGGAGDRKSYTRTVTNVGVAKSSYRCKVLSPKGVDVEVVPSEMVFEEVNEKKSYTVTFSGLGNGTRSGEVGEGYLVWSSVDDLGYEVVSTIVVGFV